MLERAGLRAAYDGTRAGSELRERDQAFACADGFAGVRALQRQRPRCSRSSAEASCSRAPRSA
jgi:hypothetical protein